MKLAQLFSIFPHLKFGSDPMRQVKGISADSRSFQPEEIFVAIKGEKFDGHSFVPEACRRGAAGIVVERAETVPDSFQGAIVVASDTRKTLGALASRFYGDPGKDLFCVGVTGTNGKTTITHMVEAIFNSFGWSTGVMGTNNHHLGSHYWTSEMTSPDALTIHRRMGEFKALGARAVAMEVSSHAIHQHRIEGVPFDVVVFSNLTQDHLDYHGTMEEYFRAKSLLFADVLDRSSKNDVFAIINNDDPYGRRLVVSSRAKVWRFGEGASDLTFQIRHMDFRGTLFEVRTPYGIGEVHLPMVGIHNLYNALAAVGVALAAGVSLDVVVSALEKFPGVKGRLQPIYNEQGLHVFVDYAHTSDALEKVLEALQSVRRGLKTQSRLITVFGCGGNRDRGKRPLMGKVAEEGSDLVFVTNDNPRSEDPGRIIEEILQGITDKESIDQRVFVEKDRRLAIARALRVAQEGDVVLIAGKGHEEYQIVGGTKSDFSDASVVKEVLSDMANGS